MAANATIEVMNNGSFVSLEMYGPAYGNWDGAMVLAAVKFERGRPADVFRVVAEMPKLSDANVRTVLRESLEGNPRLAHRTYAPWVSTTHYEVKRTAATTRLFPDAWGAFEDWKGNAGVLSYGAEMNMTVMAALSSYCGHRTDFPYEIWCPLDVLGHNVSSFGGSMYELVVELSKMARAGVIEDIAPWAFDESTHYWHVPSGTDPVEIAETLGRVWAEVLSHSGAASRSLGGWHTEEMQQEDEEEPAAVSVTQSSSVTGLTYMNAVNPSNTDLSGKFIAATGAAPVSRAEMQREIRRIGAYFESSVGPRTDILILGDTGRHGVTSKVRSAVANGVTAMSPEDFLDVAACH